MKPATLDMSTQAILFRLAQSATPGSAGLINEEDWSDDELQMAHEDLTSAGYIENYPSTLAGNLFWDLTAKGRSAAGQLLARYKRQELYKKILAHINAGNQQVTLEDVQRLTSDPIDIDKALSALRWLRGNDLIRGHEVEGSSLLRRSALTNRGEDALHSPYGPEDFVDLNLIPGVSVNNDYSQHYTGDVNNVAGNNNALNTGSGTAISSGNTTTINALEQLDQLVADLTAQLDAAGQETTQLESDAEKIREGIQKGHKELVDEGLKALTSSTMSAIGSQAIIEIGTFASLLNQLIH